MDARLLADMTCYDMLWHAMTCYDMLWHAMACYDMLWHAMTCYDMLWHAMTCYDMLWWLFLVHPQSISDILAILYDIHIVLSGVGVGGGIPKDWCSPRWWVEAPRGSFPGWGQSMVKAFECQQRHLVFGICAWRLVNNGKHHEVSCPETTH